MQDSTAQSSYQQGAVQDVGDHGLLQSEASDEEALDELGDGAAVAQLCEERRREGKNIPPSLSRSQIMIHVGARVSSHWKTEEETTTTRRRAAPRFSFKDSVFGAQQRKK